MLKTTSVFQINLRIGKSNTCFIADLPTFTLKNIKFASKNKENNLLLLILLANVTSEMSLCDIQKQKLLSTHRATPATCSWKSNKLRAHLSWQSPILISLIGMASRKSQKTFFKTNTWEYLYRRTKYVNSTPQHQDFKFRRAKW